VSKRWEAETGSNDSLKGCWWNIGGDQESGERREPVKACDLAKKFI